MEQPSSRSSFQINNLSSQHQTFGFSYHGETNNNAIDNGDVKVHPSEFPVEFNSDSVPDPDTTLIKSIDDDEMDNIL